MRQLPAIAEISAVVQEHGLSIQPAELHGALCGWLAGGGGDASEWLDTIMADPTLSSTHADAAPALRLLHEITLTQLNDNAFELQLLLPDDDAPLPERAQALFDWCGGFLGGFGLAAGADPILSEDGAEALRDLARLAGASSHTVEEEEEESALAELQEFVRIAVLLLHGDTVLAADPRSSRT